MKRGDFITVVMSGDYGKPRPALVIQSDRFCEHTSVTVLLMTGTLLDLPMLRVTVPPNLENGLRKPSQVMIDKSMSVKRNKVGPVFGHIDDDTMVEINRLLAIYLGIVK